MEARQDQTCTSTGVFGQGGKIEIHTLSHFMVVGILKLQ
jgi:hypothetical protein